MKTVQQHIWDKSVSEPKLSPNQTNGGQDKMCGAGMIVLLGHPVEKLVMENTAAKQLIYSSKTIRVNRGIVVVGCCWVVATVPSMSSFC